MKITHKEFAKVARKAMYEVIDKTAEEQPKLNAATEGIIWLTAAQFIKTSREMFKDSDEIDISEEEFDSKMNDFSSEACMTGMSAAKENTEFVALMVAILCTTINAEIAHNIEKHFFYKEENNGNSNN